MLERIQRRVRFWLDTGYASPQKMIAAHRTRGAEGWADKIAGDFDLRLFDGMKPSAYHDVSPWERARFIEVAGLVCQPPAPAVSLLRAVQYVLAANIPGAFVECGVYRGASQILIARTLQAAGTTDREIWLYDTFEGMPKPGEEDIHYTGHKQTDSWDQRRRGAGEASNEVYAPIDDVQRNVTRTGYPADKFVFVKGKVEDTIPKNAPASIALLRLDTDYFASTKHELEHLYPLLSPGGVLIIDDYGAFQGARKAVDEYFAGKPIMLFRIDENVRAGVKHQDTFLSSTHA